MVEAVMLMGDLGKIRLSLRRAPFWKYFWAQHFVTRQHVFNVPWLTNREE